jgi:hypothetical protein
VEALAEQTLQMAVMAAIRLSTQQLLWEAVAREETTGQA